MKKIILIIALLACFSAKSQAQWYLGGGIGFGTGSQNQLTVYVAPEVGYHFTNYFTLGGRLSYRSEYNQFGVDPYARMNILKPTSPVRILAYVHSPFKFANDYFSYGFYLQPGISINLGGNAWLECRAGAFGWGSVTYGSSRASGWEATVNGNNVAVGVVFSI